LRISSARGNRLTKFKQIHLHILRRADMALGKNNYILLNRWDM
jgi:hypothetical protein